jgi:TfoX/Sxy family transcriptional regulator of competence genes
MAADGNKKSVRLITGAGFVEARRLDGDYRLYVASLGAANPR